MNCFEIFLIKGRPLKDLDTGENHLRLFHGVIVSMVSFLGDFLQIPYKLEARQVEKGESSLHTYKMIKQVIPDDNNLF